MAAKKKSAPKTSKTDDKAEKSQRIFKETLQEILDKKTNSKD